MFPMINTIFHFVEHTRKLASQRNIFENQQYCLYAITHPSCVHHLLAQFRCHHYVHIKFISFSTSPRLISSSLHPQHPKTLSSPCQPMQATHTNHPLLVLHKLLLPFYSDYLYSTSQPTPQRANQVFRHIASSSCTLQDKGLHFF